MIQLQIINRILSDKSLSIVTLNGLSYEHFNKYEDEFNFILDHYDVYSNVPDKQTFISKFPEFEFCECQESEQYLLDTINEELLFTKTAEVINELGPIVEKNSNEGVEFLLSKLPELTCSTGINGVDIISRSDDRLNEYLTDKSIDNNLAIPTGFEELDEVLHGWLPGEDLVTLVARINEGKSWIMAKFAAAAWEADKRTSIYNGEMSVTQESYRIDTIMGHFSNRYLLMGNKKEEIEYKKYIKNLKKKQNPLIVVTKKELGGKLTTTKLKALIDKYELDCFFIDQFSGMESTSSKRNETLKQKYARIADELMDISSSKGIPIIGACQANRESVKDDDEQKMPELENISGADEIGALSSRVISLRNISAGLKLKITKNRYGERGQSFLYFWDIDRGNFRFIPGTSNEKQRKESKKKFNDKTEAF